MIRNMNINVLDIILVLLVVACVIAGYFKGLLRSVISFAKYALGLPLSFLLPINIRHKFTIRFFEKRR